MFTYFFHRVLLGWPFFFSVAWDLGRGPAEVGGTPAALPGFGSRVCTEGLGVWGRKSPAGSMRRAPVCVWGTKFLEADALPINER